MDRFAGQFGRRLDRVAVGGRRWSRPSGVTDAPGSVVWAWLVDLPVVREVDLWWSGTWCWFCAGHDDFTAFLVGGLSRSRCGGDWMRGGREHIVGDRVHGAGERDLHGRRGRGASGLLRCVRGGCADAREDGGGLGDGDVGVAPPARRHRGARGAVRHDRRCGCVHCAGRADTDAAEAMGLGFFENETDSWARTGELAVGLGLDACAGG